MTFHDETETHPVLTARLKIAAAFAGQSRYAGTSTGVVACLGPILDTVGWRGQPRQVFEAIPHQGAIDTVATLRAVLMRLNIMTPLTELKPAALTAAHTPCLIIARDETVTLVTGVDETGHARVFEGRTGQWTHVPAATLAGNVHRIVLEDPEQLLGQVQRHGWFVPTLVRFRGSIQAIFWYSFIINVIGLALSLYVMFIYDKAIGAHSLDTLFWLFVGAVGGIAVELRLRHIRARSIARLGSRFDALIATGVYRSVLSFPLAMTESSPLGAQLTRFRQFEVGRELFSGSLPTALLDLPFTLLFIGLVFMLGGNLGFIPVALAIILALIGLLTRPVTSRVQREVGEWKTRSDALLVEIATRFQAIDDNNAGSIWQERAGRAYATYLRKRMESQQLNATLQTVTQALVSLAGASVIALGAVEVMANTLSMGALVATMTIVWRVLTPIQTSLLSFPRLGQLYSTIRQIEQLIRMRPERLPGRVPAFERQFQGNVIVANANFRYGTRTDPVLKNVSLQIKAGEFVTITGPSGAGKSTLLKVMLGLYPLAGGIIRLDGSDLRQLDPAVIRQSIGYVGSEASLFFGTVAQNIRLVAPDATDADVIRALHAVGVSLPSPQLPEGLETRLTASFRQTLSPAFMQRLVLARAFVRPCPVLLLDEPANHLDSTGDQALLAHLARIRGKTTIIMVTARPSHMRRSDRVVVMNEGQVVGSGPPETVVPALLERQTAGA